MSVFSRISYPVLSGILFSTFLIISILTLNLNYHPCCNAGYHILDKSILKYICHGYILNNISGLSQTSGSLLQHLINYFSYYFNFLLVSVTFYIVYREPLFRDKAYVYIFILLSYLYGDYITPLLALLAYNPHSPRLGDLGIILLSISDPVLIIPYLLFKRNEKEILIRKILLMPLLILGVYVSPLYNNFAINPLFTLPKIILTFAGILIYYLIHLRGYTKLLVTMILLPFTYNAGFTLLSEDEVSYKKVTKSKKILFIVLILTILSGIFIVYNIQRYNVSYISPLLNPSLKSFIDEVIPDNTTIVSATNDAYITELLINKNLYIIPYKDSQSWNWDNASDIRNKLNDVISLSFKYNAKYILLIRGNKLPYWVSPLQYKEYKYGLIYPENTFVVILENKDYYDNRGPYYIKELSNSSGSLLSRILKIWSEDKINYSNNNGLWIYSNKSYVVYITFNISSDANKEGNYLLLSMDGGNSSFDTETINSLEIYGYTGKRLYSIWVRTNISKNQNIIIEDLNLTNYPYLTLKIDSIGSLHIKEFALEDKTAISPYTFKITGNEIKVSNNLNAYVLLDSIFKDFRVGSILYKPRSSRIFTFGNMYIGYSIEIISFFLLIYIIYVQLIRSSAKNFPRESEYIDIYNEAIIYLIPVTPIIYDLIYYPKILSISWIGDAPIVFSTIILYMVLYIFRNNLKKIESAKLLVIFLPFFYMLNQISISHFPFSVNYVDEWIVFSSISIINLVTTLSLYLLLSTIIISNTGYNDRRYMSFGLATPTIYLFLITLIYYINIFHNPLERSISFLPYINGLFTVKLLSMIGHQVSIHPYTYGTVLTIMKQGNIFNIIIGWPCSGVTGLFLYSAFMLVEYVYLDKMGIRLKGIMIILSYIIGLISIFLLNIFRITFIILLALTLGYDASELFHSFGYEFIFFIWIIFYIYIFEYLVYKRELI